MHLRTTPLIIVLVSTVLFSSFCIGQEFEESNEAPPAPIAEEAAEVPPPAPTARMVLQIAEDFDELKDSFEKRFDGLEANLEEVDEKVESLANRLTKSEHRQRIALEDFESRMQSLEREQTRVTDLVSAPRHVVFPGKKPEPQRVVQVQVPQEPEPKYTLPLNPGQKVYYAKSQAGPTTYIVDAFVDFEGHPGFKFELGTDGILRKFKREEDRCNGGGCQTGGWCQIAKWTIVK